jgi:hypothetical protein
LACGVCSVPQPRIVCAEYFASKAVVEATLIKVKAVGDPSAPEAFIYTLRSDHVIRGHPTPIFRVYEGNDSGRATFTWKVGEKYVLFLFPANEDKSAWSLDGCGSSGLLANAKVTLRQIRAIQGSKGAGIIHGLVASQTFEVSVSRLRIEVRGVHANYTATTDATGHFELKVPPGKYTIHPANNAASFQTADFSYENPDNLQVQPGGCVQVQFVATGRAP